MNDRLTSTGDGEKGRPTEGVLPWTRSCFVCGEDNPHGLRLRSRIEGGRVVIEYETREADLGWKHLVHGGISMTLLDEVMTWAAILAVRRACIAAELTTRLARPIRVPEPLRVEGWVSAVKGKLILAEAHILGRDGHPSATARGKYVAMAGDQAQLCAADFVSNPEALPPDRLLSAD